GAGALHHRSARTPRAQAERCVWWSGNRARVGSGWRELGAGGPRRAHRAIRGAGARTDSERAVSECRRRPRRVRRPHFGHRAVCVPGDIRRRVHVAPVDRCARQRHSRRRVADTDVRRGGAMKAPSLTLGIEEEYQIIDPTTRELKSYITELLAGDHLVLAQVKPELHQSIVEVGTTVCRTPAEVRAELVRLRRDIMGLTARDGLRIAAAGTHPFSSWTQQEITPLERYLGVREDM